MDLSFSGYKTFLLSCNVGLMFVGVSILVLGVKMHQLSAALSLAAVPLVGHAVRAVIATGALVSIAGISGVAGVANGGSHLLILVHLFALGVIVITEFGVGVALLVVRRTIENYIGSLECNENCATTLDSIVLQYALPSAGLMLTIIIVEAMMMYCAIKVLSSLRECPKITEPSSSTFDHDVQMQSVASPIPNLLYSPHPDRTFMVSPNVHFPLDHSPTFGASPMQAWYTPDRDFAQRGCTPSSAKPPLYASLPQHMRLPPPPYAEASRLASPAFLMPPTLKRSRSGSSHSVN
ncbi:hypothetical protein JTE90_013251 [Oedothorax gibbosus]|uniref:NADH dehydrogenase subunit 6 n=1 Tax=Oedothorax gibbosus TaxID=931172 RepID=A0AAV6VEL4_9ARAC|nr:hypothetical protein JTE90_013251 [Oedothorax gibbosus]